MASNSLGRNLTLTTFGESHGVAIGGVLDGIPPGIILDVAAIQFQLDRRRPGQSKVTTQRNESDTVQILSGVFEGKTTGAPIGFMIANKDQKSEDYSEIKKAYRPSHADYTYHQKYKHYDYRGGGRSSARETANWVVAGAIARQFLDTKNIAITAWVNRIHALEITQEYAQLDLNAIEDSIVRCPDKDTSEKMIALIDQVKQEGDSVGGAIQCIIQGVKAGIGEPIFQKLHANLAKAMMTINAVKGFEYGSGFGGTYLRGSEHNDAYIKEGSDIRTKTNNSGGIQGGISNGEDIVMKIGFKPTATINQSQNTVDKGGNEVQLNPKGRHDPCVLPRAVPIVEAMAALVIADYYC